jgi:putative hemolysin
LGTDELPAYLPIILWSLLFLVASLIEPLFTPDPIKKNGERNRLFPRFSFQALFFLRVLEIISAVLLILLFLPLFRSDWAFSHFTIALVLALILVILRHFSYRLGRALRSSRFLAVLGYPALLLSFVFYPFVFLARLLGDALRKPILLNNNRGDLLDSHSDLSGFLETTDDEQSLAEQEKEMIQGIVDFRETQTREIMVPRIDLVAAEVTDPIAKIKEIIIETGHSRIPIYQETIDNIIGIVHAKDLLRAEKEGGKLADYLRQPSFVPETKRVNQLLNDFQKTKMHMAIVVDEYGGTAGIVTIEDIMEEIVGEIQDEYDFEEPLVRHLPDGSYLVNAKIDIEELNEALGINLPSEDFESLGGYILERLERVPRPGEVITEDNLSIKIKDSNQRRVSWTIITKTEGKKEKESSPERE